VSAYVTDTHPLVWYAAGKHRKLSRKALRVFNAAARDEALVYVPAFVGSEKLCRRFPSSMRGWSAGDRPIAQPGRALIESIIYQDSPFLTPIRMANSSTLAAPGGDVLDIDEGGGAQIQPCGP